MKKGFPVYDPTHEWGKTSLVTERGGFDWYTCKRCGLKGKRHGLSDTIQASGRKKLITECDGKPRPVETPTIPASFSPRRIKIKQVIPCGKKSANLKVDTIHATCPPPPGEGPGGTWVMGVGCALLLNEWEFDFIPDEPAETVREKNLPVLKGYTPQLVEIKVQPRGGNAKNLTVSSKHWTCPPPAGKSGIWVFGIIEPESLSEHEFKIVKSKHVIKEPKSVRDPKYLNDITYETCEKCNSSSLSDLCETRDRRTINVVQTCEDCGFSWIIFNYLENTSPPGQAKDCIDSKVQAHLARILSKLTEAESRFLEIYYLDRKIKPDITSLCQTAEPSECTGEEIDIETTMFLNRQIEVYCDNRINELNQGQEPFK